MLNSFKRLTGLISFKIFENILFQDFSPCPQPMSQVRLDIWFLYKCVAEIGFGFPYMIKSGKSDYILHV